MSTRIIGRVAGTVISAGLMALSITTTAGAATTTTAQPAAVAPVSSAASFSSCLPQDFCAWSGPNGTGTKKAYYKCQTISRPFSTTNGSAYNHQTGGAKTVITFTDGSKLALVPGDKIGIDWRIVRSIKTC